MSLTPNAPSPASLPTARFAQALDYANRKHQTQTRKASDIPYISHLLGVCSLVMENTGDEDTWIAALLHDAVEDQGGVETAHEITQLFGDRVAKIVLGCTDAAPDVDRETAPWLQRKTTYLDNLHHEEDAILLVSICDKIHNARSIQADMRKLGDDIYQRFNAGKTGTHWYYQTLVAKYRESGRVPFHLIQELEETVASFAPNPIDIEAVKAALANI